MDVEWGDQGLSGTHKHDLEPHGDGLKPVSMVFFATGPADTGILQKPRHFIRELNTRICPGVTDSGVKEAAGR